jgi:hypothetical protein
LKDLELPARIYKCDARSNHIERLSFRGDPVGLQYLDLENNRLQAYNFKEIPPELEYFNIRFNDINPSDFTSEMMDFFNRNHPEARFR